MLQSTRLLQSFAVRGLYPGHLHEHREGNGMDAVHDAAQKAKGRLCGKRPGGPAALG